MNLTREGKYFCRERNPRELARHSKPERHG
jgi:hypothetical protein